jgi:2-polyprenyl-3-methyl-5-hydroxy-6-metoxy-1,4-benzoquinol methylase
LFKDLKSRQLPKEYFKETRVEMLPFVPLGAKRVLEVGCGEGTFGHAVKVRNDAQVWGIELNPKAAQKSRMCLDKVLVGDINVVLKSLPKRYFDCVVFNDVLEHLPNPEEILNRVKSNLSSDGKVVCSIPNVLHIKLLIGLLIKRDWEYTNAGTLDRTHLRFFTKKSILRMMTNCGYETIRIKGINEIRSYTFKALKLLTLGILNETSYLQYACVARKAQRAGSENRIDLQ